MKTIDIKESEIFSIKGMLCKWETHEDSFLLKFLPKEISEKTNFSQQTVPNMESLLNKGPYKGKHE